MTNLIARALTWVHRRLTGQHSAASTGQKRPVTVICAPAKPIPADLLTRTILPPVPESELVRPFIVALEQRRAGLILTERIRREADRMGSVRQRERRRALMLATLDVEADYTYAGAHSLGLTA